MREEPRQELTKEEVQCSALTYFKLFVEVDLISISQVVVFGPTTLAERQLHVSFTSASRLRPPEGEHLGDNEPPDERRHGVHPTQAGNI